MTKHDEMKKIRDELFVFKQSPLYEYRTTNKYYPVIGEGSHDAKIMFVGEAPGKNEAETGRPFCGVAGKFLTELLESIGQSRDKVYITNVVKDRPPENRDPTLEEIELYAPFLDRQVEIIQPRVIATLGRHSMGYIMKRYGLDLELDAISKIHGKAFETESRFGATPNDIPRIESHNPVPLTIVTLYHPAAALYNGGMRDTLRKDFEVLKKFL